MRYISSQQEFILRRGRVPAQRLQNIQRTAFLKELYEKLNVLILNKTSWLGVFGIVGCGKSQLVVDLLWNYPELTLAHFQHIFWLTVRNSQLIDVAMDAMVFLTDEIDDIDKNLMCLNSKYIGSKIYSALNKFSNSSKILIIIDGVLNVDVLRFFNENKTSNCYFIATSTSGEIFSALENPILLNVNCYDVTEADWAKIAQNFELNLSSTWLKKLTHAAGYNLCLMEKVFKLAQRDEKTLPCLLHRLKYMPLRELSCTTSYYESNLENPIQSSFENVSNRICNAFENLVVFKPLRNLSLKLLLLIWPIDLCGIEPTDVIEGLIKEDLENLRLNSLLERSQGDEFFVFPNSEESELLKDQSFYDTYRIFYSDYFMHPIIYSFLVHNRLTNYLKFKKIANNINLDLYFQNLLNPSHAESKEQNIIKKRKLWAESLYNLQKEVQEEQVVLKNLANDNHFNFTGFFRVIKKIMFSPF